MHKWLSQWLSFSALWFVSLRFIRNTPAVHIHELLSSNNLLWWEEQIHFVCWLENCPSVFLMMIPLFGFLLNNIRFITHFGRSLQADVEEEAFGKKEDNEKFRALLGKEFDTISNVFFSSIDPEAVMKIKIFWMIFISHLPSSCFLLHFLLLFWFPRYNFIFKSRKGSSFTGSINNACLGTRIRFKKWIHTYCTYRFPPLLLSLYFSRGITWICFPWYFYCRSICFNIFTRMTKNSRIVKDRCAYGYQWNSKTEALSNSFNQLFLQDLTKEYIFVQNSLKRCKMRDRFLPQKLHGLVSSMSEISVTFYFAITQRNYVSDINYIV